MTNNDGRLQLGIIWGLVAGLAVLQVVLWRLAGGGLDGASLLYLVAGWVVVLSLAVLASRGIGTLTERLTARENAHRATLDEVQQLQTQNAMLQIVARSVDVALTFQALAVRIAGLVPCDRVGLALLTETGQEFETFTARVQEDERRNRPRPDVVFKVDSTAIGQVVRTLEPLLINDVGGADVDLLDVNVLVTAGFKSVLILPLVSSGRGRRHAEPGVARGRDRSRRRTSIRCGRSRRSSPSPTSRSSCTCCSAGTARPRRWPTSCCRSPPTSTAPCRPSSATATCWSAATRIRPAARPRRPWFGRPSGSRSCWRRCGARPTIGCARSRIRSREQASDQPRSLANEG